MSATKSNQRSPITVAPGQGTEPEIFIDKAEVSKRLGLRPRTVGVWVKKEKLPAYRFGRYLRFKWSEIEGHLAATCLLAHGKADGGSAKRMVSGSESK